MSRGRVPTRVADDQGFTEILIVIALVAITAIGVASLFGEQIEELFSGKPPEAQTAAPTKPQPPSAPETKNPPSTTRDAQPAPAK